MNKELCIKVCTWNNSILWCTVEETSNNFSGYVKQNYIRSSTLHIIPEAITSYRTHCSVSIRMTEYKWQTFKALSLPSPIPCLLLIITFHFFLITHSSVLNSFHTFFFTLLFFDWFLLSQNPSSITPTYFSSPSFPPYLIIVLLHGFLFSFNTFFYLPLAYSSILFPICCYHSSVSFPTHLLSLSSSSILLPLSHVFPLFLLYFFPLMNNFVFRIWNG